MKAEEQARKAYPDNPYYGGRSAQRLFAEGYEQAAKDLMDKAKQNVNERLNEFRNFLISETERYQEMAKSPNASPCGSHFDRGQANGFISVRGKLEELFDLWDNL